LVYLVKCFRNSSLQLPVNIFLEEIEIKCFSLSLLFKARTLSLVLLRRLISTSIEEHWNSLSEDKKSALKQELLVAVQHESDSNIRKKISDVIAELARFLIGKNDFRRYNKNI